MLKNLILLLLVSTVACGQMPPVKDPAQTVDVRGPSDASSSVNTDEILKRYLGKWRPTSFAEQQNIVSLSITASDLSLETGGSLRFEVRRVIDDAVMVRVTERSPGAFVGTGAMAFLLEEVTTRNVDATRTRAVLRIYWCEREEQLNRGLQSASCSRNSYVR